MSLESVLSEILGVPCGNVKFHREGISLLLPESEYLHSGLHTSVTSRIEFSTLERIDLLYPNNKFGSIYIGSQDWYSTGESPVKEFGYTAYLLKGEETSERSQRDCDLARIVRAIADELVSE